VPFPMTDFIWKESDSVLEVIGDLTLNALPYHLPTIKETQFSIDLSKSNAIDTSGIYYILDSYRKEIAFVNTREDQQEVIELVQSRFGNEDKLQTPSRQFDFVSRIGVATLHFIEVFSAHMYLLGQTTYSVLYYALNPSKIRKREIFSQLQQTALNAIPVIVLVNFLIGIVMAYLLSMQAEKYGASIFVVDGVALAMCREMSPILVAIILAGRSGSAFTAQLGAMKLTEEIDALKSIGLKTFDVLVFPRILALLVALPLLVFVGDIVGMYGGMLATKSYFGLTSLSFYQRLESVLRLRHILVGLIKAPFFALAIGLIACRVGLSVSQDAKSVGLATTTTVVTSIVVVILLNASFTVLFAELGF
ncbi:MAG: ABC transporter permease, partial [Bdellovibrionales bacterium]|nr:ABC transporter permease [Bdellovibrionales bacterium]